MKRMIAIPCLLKTSASTIEEWFRVRATSPLTNLPIGRRLEPRPRRRRSTQQLAVGERVHVDIPTSCDPEVLRQLEGDTHLRRHLERLYGITITLLSLSPVAGACPQSLVLTMNSRLVCDDALAVAKADLEEFLQEPSKQVETIEYLWARAREECYVFIDYSTIALREG